MAARLALAVMRAALRATVLAVTALMVGACTAGTAGEAGSGDPGAPMEITWLSLRAGRVQPDGPIQRAIEERFDVRLTNFTQGVGGPTVDVMIGADGHPDAMYTWADHDTWFEAGAYRTITQDMIRAHAPLLAGTLDDLGHAAWLLTAVPGTDGDELRGIPRHSVHQAGAQNMPAIRYDWFEQAGMTGPLGIGQDRISTFESREGVVDVNPVLAPGHFFVSYHTITIPDLEEALERIVSLDPAGGGRTIGMTSSNRVGRPCYHRAWGILCQAYGVSSEPWWVHADADGNGVIAHVAAGVRSALRDLQRWWRKGLLDPDTPMVDRAAMDARVAAGVVAVSNRYVVTCLDQRTLELGGGRPPCDAFRAYPDSKWLRFHAVTAPDGTYGLRHENKALPLSHPGEWFVVRHDVPDGKLARILQIYDWVNFNCEGRLLTQYGVDGEHYTQRGRRHLLRGRSGLRPRRVRKVDRGRRRAGGGEHGRPRLLQPHQLPASGLRLRGTRPGLAGPRIPGVGAVPRAGRPLHGAPHPHVPGGCPRGDAVRRAHHSVPRPAGVHSRPVLLPDDHLGRGRG
ncbi:MAG: hypothetical protein OXQ31_16090 [Spirochaetaceae bacterium]|nr:hypothetical protein [Spirochaetaceae bacterium]